jgi:hypothetical protein
MPVRRWFLALAVPLQPEPQPCPHHPPHRRQCVWVNVTVPQALNHVAIGASDVYAICRHAHSQLSCIPSWAARAAALSSWWGRYRAQQPGLALRINHASTGQVQHQRPPYTPSC